MSQKIVEPNFKQTNIVMEEPHDRKAREEWWDEAEDLAARTNPLFGTAVRWANAFRRAIEDSIVH